MRKKFKVIGYCIIILPTKETANVCDISVSLGKAGQMEKQGNHLDANL
jgi:hypothetical protein